jgi:hypothetical protein
MRNNQVKYTALCGIFAGVAITIMYLGGLIPFATYTTPMLCILIEQIILSGCGRKFAWTWYAAVSILSLILCPDKEASLLFLLLGSYPCLKQLFDKSKLSFLWKLLYFQLAIYLLYLLISVVLGLNDIVDEYRTLGKIGLATLLIFGNITFLLLDKILSFRFRKTK